MPYSTRCAALLLMGFTSVWLASSAGAQTHVIVMKTNPEIKGSHVSATHTDWIPLLSAALSVRNDFETGSVGSGGGGTVTLKEPLEIVKLADESDAKLFGRVVTAAPLQCVKIETLRDVGGSFDLLSRITIGETIDNGLAAVTSMTPRIDENGLVQALAFDYTAIQVTSVKYPGGGQPPVETSECWDFLTNTDTCPASCN